MLFLSTKHVDSLLSLTSTEEVSTFEVSNLQLPRGSSAWRSTTSNPTITGEFDVNKLIKFAGLWYNKSISTDWMRIRFAATQAELATNPTYDANHYMYPGSTGFHQGYDFGAVSHVDFGDVAGVSTGDFTIQVVAKRTENTTFNVAVSKRGGVTSSDVGYHVFMGTADHCRMEICDGTNEVTSTNNDGMLTSSSTYQTFSFVVDRTADTITAYNGATAYGGTTDISSITGTLDNAESLLISRLGGNYDVAIAEVRVFTRALTSAEISNNHNVELDKVNPPANLALYWQANEYSGTTAIDSSGNGNNGTITGAVVRENIAPVTSANQAHLDSYDELHQRIILPSAVSAKWFDIEFNWRGNSLGYVQGGRLIIDGENEIIPGETRNADISPRIRGIRQVDLSEGGIDRTVGMYKRPVGFRFDKMSDANYYGTFLPFVIDNLNKPVAVVLTPIDEATYPMRGLYYGYMSPSAVESSLTQIDVRVSMVEP